MNAWSVFLMLFLPFVYGYPSSCPRAHCTPNKSVPILRYTRRHGPIIYSSMPIGTYRVQSLRFPKIVYWIDRFYVALFSSLEQTQCAFVSRDSEQRPSYYKCLIQNVEKSAGISTCMLRLVVLSTVKQWNTFFASNLSFSQHSLASSLFTNEEQKKLVWWRI